MIIGTTPLRHESQEWLPPPTLMSYLERVERFRVLAGLTATGPGPEQFSATSQGQHREGLVVQFLPESENTWIGNFQPGATGFNMVIPCVGGDTILVIAGGQGYEVHPGVRLEAWGGHGIRWQSCRISWDGMRNVRVEGDTITGEAWSPVTTAIIGSLSTSQQAESRADHTTGSDDLVAILCQ